MNNIIPNWIFQKVSWEMQSNMISSLKKIRVLGLIMEPQLLIFHQFILRLSLIIEIKEDQFMLHFLRKFLLKLKFIIQSKIRQLKQEMIKMETHTLIWLRLLTQIVQLMNITSIDLHLSRKLNQTVDLQQEELCLLLLELGTRTFQNTVFFLSAELENQLSELTSSQLTELLAELHPLLTQPFLLQ